jgi:hypothetical protein
MSKGSNTNDRSAGDSSRSFWRRLAVTLGLLGLALGLAWGVLVLIREAGEGLLGILADHGEAGARPLAAVFLGRCLIVGFLSMALIQMARGLFPLRGRFHERQVRLWLAPGHGPTQAEPTDDSGQATKDTGDRDPVGEMVDRLVEHAVTSRSEELFDLPIERLCGQIGAAAELVVDRPEGQEELLRGLAGREHADRYLESWREEQAARKVSPEVTGEQEDQDGLRPSKSEDVEDLVTARHAVEQRIQRNIDGLQISTGVRWRRRLRLLAIAISFVLAVGLIGPPIRDPGWWFSLIVTSLVAGYVASVARDVTAIIERARG